VPALLTVALGIGISAAVFSLVYAVLLRPLPYGDPERLVRVYTVLAKDRDQERNASLLDIEDYNRRSKLTENFGAWTVFESQLEGDGATQAVTICQLNQEALRALNVAPKLGRIFTADEDRSGGPVHKAVLSHAMWQSRYAGDPNIVGRTVRTPMTSLEIVGVMPAGFIFPDRADLWVPMESWYSLGLDLYGKKQRDQRWYATVARLKHGVSLDQAQSEMEQISAQLEQEYPKENAGVRVKLRPYAEAATGAIRPYLYLLIGGVLLVLAVSIVNVGNLLLARVLARQKQYVVQAALGASRWRLARSMLAESVVLSSVGGVAGSGVAWAAIRLFRTLLPDTVPRWMAIEISPAVILFGFGLSLIAGCAVALVPIFYGSRINLDAVLRQGTRGNSGAGGLRSALVVGEVALSLVLLVGAGLLTQTFYALQRADHGFTTENLVVARVGSSLFPKGERATRARMMADFHSRLQETLARIPGVQSVAVANRLPYAGTEVRSGRLRVQGRSEDELRFLLPVAASDVHWDFFEAMKIPLVKGRHFEQSDSPEAPPVVILNESGAKALFGDLDPIGRMVQMGDTVGPANPYCRVVGIVKDVRWEAGVDKAIQLYYPFTQWSVGTGFYLLRTSSDLQQIAPAIRSALQTADSRAALVWVKSMSDRIDEALWQRRLWGAVFSAFAVIAVALASVGLYGVLAYAVSQRTREIGIRVAVGAAPARVLALVARDGLKLTILGLLVGGLLAFGAVRLIASLVEGSVLRDWSIYAAVAAVLLLIGVAASAVPAIRAARVDPLIALREE
jgi:predicted permease